ncbi:MAG: nucleoside-diphosphate sugar epimerase [Chloroflexi bacterium HGW-Chloroflexi-1]|nr:MAG: nucleoside-diphosphate sugar epimerase [Chloroflexi bacterium HGW-Chloroflexi-1]
MKVLVTGGAGFVGSQLVAALIARGDAVRVLRRANSSLIALDGRPVEHAIGDILDVDAVVRAVAGCDLVFHVAALSSYWRARREQVYRVNVEGTRIVLDACVRAGVPRVVHTSSVAAIGIAQNGGPANEDIPFDPVSASFAYADSKHRAEAEVYRAIDRGLDAVIVNPAAVIGAGDHHLISSSAVIAFARRTAPAVPAGGMCVADVAAVAQGHLAAAERGRVGERYILGGENLTHRQLAEIIVGLAGRPIPRFTIPRWVLGPAAVAVDAFNRVSHRPPVVSGEQIRLSGIDFFFDSSKAVRELGYPLLPAAAAIEQAFVWYREHGYLA